MLTEHHLKKYNEFYESTHNNEYLDEKIELLVGLAAAIALNCQPCTEYYIKKSKKGGISKGEISEVLAKVMAVSAGQKRLQTSEVLANMGVEFDSK